MMTKLFDLSFWFSVTSFNFSPLFLYGFFILFALCACAAVFLRVASRRAKLDALYRHALGMGASGLLTLSITGYIWLFCTYEEAPLFGARAWFLLWLALALFFIGRIVWYLKRKAPEIRERNKSQAAVNKYLPRR